MNQKLVSIIMNCFNGEKYLNEAIESVLNQDYENWELIFWDNQSTDNSSNIFKSYKDSRLKYHYAKSHTKLYEARNYAISYAQGDFLSFLDTDDCWFQDKLSSQVPLFNNPKVGIVYSNYTILDEMVAIKYEVKTKLYRGNITSQLLKEYFIGLLTLMIRKEAYDKEEHKFDSNLQIIGDLDLTVRLSGRWEGDFCEKNLAICRKHGENLLIKESGSNTKELMYWQDKISTNKNIINSKGYIYFIQNTHYLNIKQDIKDNKLLHSIQNLLKIRNMTLFIKGLIIIAFPARLILFIKNAQISKIK
tara:strand:- start:44 stop:955 length:912 start_codon:yes stop_codon:yes gene_type:complete